MAPTFDFAFLDSEERIDECEELDTKAMPYQPAKNPGKGAPPDFKNLDESDLFEAPDDETAASVLLAANMLGNIRSQTMRGFTEPEMEKILARIPGN